MENIEQLIVEAEKIAHTSKRWYNISICNRVTQVRNSGAALKAIYVGKQAGLPPGGCRQGKWSEVSSLLENCATGSYVTARLMDLLKIKPSRTLRWHQDNNSDLQSKGT